jgi:hypothetical protein
LHGPGGAVASPGRQQGDPDAHRVVDHIDHLDSIRGDRGMPKLPFEWGTANRDVLAGVDIRETDYVDGFDVHQCRTPAALEPDLCPNAHGLDQNIYGQSLTLPVG